MNILDRIIETKLEELARDQQTMPLCELKRRIGDQPLPEKSRFSRALVFCDEPALIGEIKKASPSKGLIRQDFDPAALASAYAEGGACALSVLTERKHFQGMPEHLLQAKSSAELPVLRKDFMVCAYQIYESRLLGADCVLLIAAALDNARLRDFIALAEELALDALVEVHDEAELERAAVCRAGIIGVNNRHLGTFEVSLDVSRRLAPLFPDAVIKVSESGISTHDDIRQLGSLGYDAVLVGEHLMRQSDVARAARTLMTGGC